MSIDATRWAWKKQLPSTQKLVLLAMADRADENHRCYPSISRLHCDTGLDRETIMRSIAKLEENGFLRVDRREGSSSIYWLIGVEDRHADGCETSRQMPTPTSRQMPTPTSRQMPTPTSRKMPTPQSENADTHQSENADTESTSRTYHLTDQENDTTLAPENSGKCVVSLPAAQGPTAEGQLAKTLRQAGVDITSAHPELLRWCAEGVTVEFAMECVELARKTKPGRIPAKYLGAIIDGERAKARESPGTMTQGRQQQPRQSKQPRNAYVTATADSENTHITPFYPMPDIAELIGVRGASGGNIQAG